MNAVTAPGLDLDAGLRALGYSEFRPGQREAIETLVEKRRLLLVAPTGGGKSLAYQLPAWLLPGTTLVLSPLIALMHDQVQAMEERGVPATLLASTLDAQEVRRRMARIAAGQYKLVYIAPERIVFPGFRGLLRDIEIALVAIDEAHCISEWGHDFRPEYLQIGELVTELSRARVLACTATATPIVRDEILARLGLPPETPQIVRGFARPNLALRAAEVEGKRDREARVDAQLQEAIGTPGSARGVAIVYAPTRKQTEEEALRLTGQRWRVAAYHAGMSGPDRDVAQRAFREGAVDVVVATNAFGMGIDRADVRAVVHLAPPSSIEAYYQEVGRAGRDGAPAYGLMLMAAGDIPLRRRLLEGGGNENVFAHKWGLFLELLRWAEGGSCRHDAILRYFGDEAETLHGCGQCDVCLALEDDDRPDPETTTLIVRKVLSGVARVHGRFGTEAAVRLLHGTSDPRLSSSRLDITSTFGVLKDYPEDWILKVLRRCITAGWVDFTPTDRPMLLLTEVGRAVMKAERPARLLLPSRSAAPRPKGSGSRPRGARPAPGEHALDAAGEKIFEALRAHRLSLARAQDVPPYVIASDRTLRELATLRPTSRAELLEVHGIGETKADRFGDGFLAVIRGARPPDPT
jgi:ATP-dependent DNA helicase RecQ